MRHLDENQLNKIIASEERMTLLQAAEYMDKHGWCRCQMKNKETGAVCVLGAIRESGKYYSTGRVEATMLLVAKYLGHGDLIGCVAMWNDHRCRSKEEAVKVLIGAASQ